VCEAGRMPNVGIAGVSSQSRRVMGVRMISVVRCIIFVAAWVIVALILEQRKTKVAWVMFWGGFLVLVNQVAREFLP
jgi:hypothetical protein